MRNVAERTGETAAHTSGHLHALRKKLSGPVARNAHRHSRIFRSFRRLAARDRKRTIISGNKRRLRRQETVGAVWRTVKRSSALRQYSNIFYRKCQRK